MRRSRNFILIAIILCAGYGESPAFQTHSSQTVWECFRQFILPRSLNGTYRLRSYITDSENMLPSIHIGKNDVHEFSRIRSTHLRRLDDIFIEAIKIAEGDIPEALLISAGATLPYYVFPALIPIINITINVPVSTESRERFDRRMENLPSKLLNDTPSYGDRDKLPHFFGSAFLYCAMKSEALVRCIGVIVEALESVFKLEGSYDERDLHADQLGIEFAKAIMERENALPSEIFLADMPIK